MKNKIKIAIIIGTRPEIIKTAPIIRECQKKKVNFFVLHTGQHYSRNMDEIFFKELNIPSPKYNLNIGSQPYRKQVGIMVREITGVLLKEKPNLVVVQGDTISVLAGALAATKLGIKIAHHESGLRSHDTAMLEEVIRVLVDHISDLLMAPTLEAVKNLREEGKESSKIFLTGNTIVDALMQGLEISSHKDGIIKKAGLKKGEYFLVTCHRAEVVDNKEKLKDILNGLSLVYEELKIPLLFPIHPRTTNRIKEFGLKVPDGLILVQPMGFLEFLQLEKNARLILTDSGGVQEEAFILGIPCVTMRDNTERPETLKYGMNILTKISPQGILKAVQKMMVKKKSAFCANNFLGDGTAAKKIMEVILKELDTDKE